MFEAEENAEGFAKECYCNTQIKNDPDKPES
jgi:hypothetical protein